MRVMLSVRRGMDGSMAGALERFALHIRQNSWYGMGVSECRGGWAGVAVDASTWRGGNDE